MSRESATVQKITQEPKRKNTRVFKRCFGTNEIVIFRIKVLKSSSAYYIIVKLYQRTFSSVGQSHRLITGLSGVQVPEGPPSHIHREHSYSNWVFTVKSQPNSAHYNSGLFARCFFVSRIMPTQLIIIS